MALGVAAQGSHRSGRAYINASGSSTSRFAALTVPEAIQWSDVDMRMNLDVFGMFPSAKSAGRRSAFLRWVLQGEFPSFNGTIRALRLPAVRLAALRFLLLAIPRLHPSFRSRADECAAGAWSWSPGVSGRDSAEERAGSPKFLGNLDGPFAMFQTDAGRTARTRPLRCSSAAPAHRKAEAPAIGSFDAG